MNKLIIFGGSGIGMIAASVAEDLGYFEVAGFLNDFMETGSFIGKYKRFPVLGRSEDYSKYLSHPEYLFFVACRNAERKDHL